MHAYSNLFTGVADPAHLLVRVRESKARRPEIRRAPNRAKQLRADEIQELLASYDQVRNIREVARRFNVSRTTVAKFLGLAGVDTSQGMNSAQIATAARLYVEGRSSVAIGQQLGFDNHTVLKALVSEGLEIRGALGRPK